MSDDTYREKCHVDGCATRFVGVTREEYINHLAEDHSLLTGSIWDRLVIDNG